MTDSKSLVNHFLIAMPSLDDPNFSQTVTYICEHNDAGAMGIVINRPIRLTVGEVLEHMQITPGEHVDVEQSVVAGGPVQGEHGFVLHTPAGKWNSSANITDDIAVTTSRDILMALADGKGPARYLLALGYAGWAAGQLEREMAENAWLSGPANAHILFDLPLQERWRAAAALIGIDLDLLSTEVGHA